MSGATEAELLGAVANDPSDPVVRMVYADWLEERGDRRSQFVRAHARVAPLAPDHPERRAGEEELSRHRVGLDAAWLAVVEPERRRIYGNESEVRGCSCFVAPDGPDGDDDDDPPLPVPVFHREPQDTECEAWRRLCDYVDRCATDGTLRFQPRPELTPEQWCQIVTLPPSIAKLTAVTSIDLYGSHLVRLPPEIGAMTSLRVLTPYTSYRLHWFPYEITRCKQLGGSTVSTRALYGNYKFRPPFPSLALPRPLDSGPARPCSVCDRPFEDLAQFRVWISLRVGSDILPLLVNACSAACIAELPAPPEGYVAGPHRGGADVVQPPRR